jgi:hypothetical protein
VPGFESRGFSRAVIFQNEIAPLGAAGRTSLRYAIRINLSAAAQLVTTGVKYARFEVESDS